MSMGNEALSAGRLREAIEHFTKEIELHPTQALPYTKRAAAYSKLQRDEDALADLNVATSLDPSHMPSFVDRSRMLTKFCRYSDALEGIEYVLSQKPSHKAALEEKVKLVDLKVRTKIEDIFEGRGRECE